VSIRALYGVGPGRYTALTNEPFAVFLIGLRMNRFLSFGKWMQVFKAMPPMIEELKRHPELGFIHTVTALYWRGVINIQYWRSFEHLHAYGHMRDGIHLPAWAEFNRRVSNNGAVGIWHETYMLQPGQYEAIHVNMPRFGLMQAFEHVRVTGRLDSARGRMGKPEADSIPKA
jgi:Domain of unknown function (DUF4188)